MSTPTQRTLAWFASLTDEQQQLVRKIPHTMDAAKSVMLFSDPLPDHLPDELPYEQVEAFMSPPTIHRVAEPISDQEIQALQEGTEP